MSATKLSDRAPLLALLLLTVARLWLVAGEEIYGSSTFDAVWNLAAAEHWYWGADYHWTAFVRPPAYPVWIALVHALGLPLRIATESLQVSGLLLLAIAFRRAGFPSWTCVFVYAGMILHPAAFEMNSYTLSDTFYGTMLPFAVAGLIWTLVTQKKRHALWTGTVLAVLWSTREESVLLVGLLVLAALLVWWQTKGVSSSGRGAARVIWPAQAVMAGTLALIVLGVYTANLHVFRAFAKSAMSAPAFTSAYKALLSVRPSHPIPRVPVAREARLLAYAASPAFARLQPHLEGKIGRAWEKETFEQMGIRDEIAAGWMPWALQDAAQAIGEHENARRAERFFHTMTREIRQAERSGKLPSRRVWAGLLDPGASAALSALPASFVRVAGVFVLPYEPRAGREDAALAPVQRSLYERLAWRHATATDPDRASGEATTIRAWLGATYRY
ncbi:MAG: hypothetical protein ABI883_09660, partial [Chthoniobacterales bacterium]